MTMHKLEKMADNNPVKKKPIDFARSYQKKLLQNYRIHLIQSRKIDYYHKTWRKWMLRLTMKKKMLEDEEEDAQWWWRREWNTQCIHNMVEDEDVSCEILSAYTWCLKIKMKCSVHTQDEDEEMNWLIYLQLFKMLWKTNGV